MRAPIYQQLNVALRELLINGDLKPGARFLTERQVAERYGVSRITANKALANLVSERLLEFRKGIGTFVRGSKLDYNLRSLTSFTEMVESTGGAPSTQVLEFQKSRESLPQLDSKAAYFVERLRLADAKPVILERRHIVADYCPGLKKTDLDGSIYKLWRERYFLAIAGAEQTIRAINIKGRESELLQVKRGSAGLLNTSIGYLEGRQPLWYEETLYRGDAYEFFNRLGHIESPEPAFGRLISPL